MLTAAPSPAYGAKSAEAFRTISEVAVELDVPQHVLRFWESRFSQIKPVKRGGGRRYYRPQDVDLLRGIRTLLYSDGFTIKGVQKLIREQGMRYVAELGRADCTLIGRLSEIPADEEHSSRPRPVRPARAVIGVVETSRRAATDEDEAFAAAPGPRAPRPVEDRGESLDEAVRVKLELLLAELLQLKNRLRSGAPRSWAAAAE